MLYRHQEQLVFKETPKSNTSVQHKTGITEIVLPDQQNLDLVLPSLAFLSQGSHCHSSNERWLTWLPPTGFKKEILKGYNFDLSRVRFVYPKTDDQCFLLLREALSKGNSHTVVGSPERLNRQQVQQLELASIEGQSSGLILRHRSH